VFEFGHFFPLEWFPPLPKRSNPIQLFIKSIKNSFVVHMHRISYEGLSSLLLQLIFIVVGNLYCINILLFKGLK